MPKNKKIYLFILSLFIGLLLLGIDILVLQSNKQPLNSSAIAKINNQYINEDQFLKYAVSLGADFRAQEDQELIDLVLERMIEEELLVQRARGARARRFAACPIGGWQSHAVARELV